MTPSIDRRALAAALADEPGWVDTRGMLLSGRCRVLTHDVSAGYVALSPDWKVASVVGHPARAFVLEAVGAGGAVTVVARPASTFLRQWLPAWVQKRATLHALSGQLPVEVTQPGVAVFQASTAPPLNHAPSDLRSELVRALTSIAGEASDHKPVRPTPIAAAFSGGLAVSFCYPVWQTERWWDVSVDTIEGYRGQGLAVRAAAAMIAFMAARGKRPVWGALEDNAASLRVAAKLGFVPVDELLVLTRV